MDSFIKKSWLGVPIVLLLIALTFHSNISAQQSHSLKGKKALMIIASQNFRDEELEKPREILRGKGIKVTIASSSLNIAKGMLGLRIKPDILIENAQVEDYDAIIFVGGTGATEYFNNSIAHQIVQKAYKQNKVLAAICIAPVTLANAGVLSGKKATVWKSERKTLEAKGAIFTGNSVEVDGKIITANGPQAAEQFGKAIVEALRK